MVLYICICIVNLIPLYLNYFCIMDETKQPFKSDAINQEESSLSQDDTDKTPLSKRQQKRLIKRLKWLEEKPMRRLKDKEKRKLKRKKAAESGRSLGPSRKLLKSSKMANSPCKLKICFDLSLTNLMTPEEFSKTVSQLRRCYSINRRADAPLQLYIAGFSDGVKKLLMDKADCYNWDINISQESYCDIFGKNNIIYLSSDSPNVLENLDYDKAYIIGALVDHNRLKNVCHEKAIEKGVGHASLPLDKYFNFKTRKVLTIDQVYSIFLRLTEGNTWIDAIAQTVPKRKGIELKTDNSVHSSIENSNEEINSIQQELSLDTNSLESNVSSS